MQTFCFGDSSFSWYHCPASPLYNETRRTWGESGLFCFLVDSISYEKLQDTTWKTLFNLNYPLMALPLSTDLLGIRIWEGIFQCRNTVDDINLLFSKYLWERCFKRVKHLVYIYSEIPFSAYRPKDSMTLYFNLYCKQNIQDIFFWFFIAWMTDDYGTYRKHLPFVLQAQQLMDLEQKLAVAKNELEKAALDRVSLFRNHHTSVLANNVRVHSWHPLIY